MNQIRNNLGVPHGTMGIVVLVLLVIVQIVPVVLIAVNCHPKQKFLHGVLAFFFDRIYLFVHAVLKYVVKMKGYCGNK